MPTVVRVHIVSLVWTKRMLRVAGSAGFLRWRGRCLNCARVTWRLCAPRQELMSLKWSASCIVWLIEHCGEMLVCDRVKALRFIGSLLCCKPDRSLWPVLIRIVVPKLLNLTAVSYTHLRAHETRHDLV